MDPKADPTPFLRGLYQFLPPDRIAHILTSTGRQPARLRRIPAEAATRLVVALGLFADLPIPRTADPDPVESAFCQARQRLSVPPCGTCSTRSPADGHPPGDQGELLAALYPSSADRPAAGDWRCG